MIDSRGWRRHLGAVGRVHPVFVDSTGRRRRIAVLAGAGMAAGLIAWLGLLLAGLFTGGPLPIPGWPEAGARPHREQADAERVVPSPTRLRAPVIVSTAAPFTPATPTARPTPRVPGNPSPGPSERPGLGDEHRRSPRAKPSKSPGKPS